MANTTKKTTTTESKTTKPKAPKKFKPDDLIECRSVTAGELILVGPKTKLQYTWADFGDCTMVEYQDLQALQSLKSNFLVKPRFIIQNDDLVEQWNSMLKTIYDKIYNESIDDLFELPVERFKSALANFPDGMKDSVKTVAINKIKSEELYDIRKVRAIDEALGTDFVDMYLK